MIMCPTPPTFQQTVKFENKYLDRYLLFSARSFGSKEISLPPKVCFFPICAAPSKEALQKAREKYESDKAYYLATGELPKED